jgi:hypothetical protein
MAKRRQPPASAGSAPRPGGRWSRSDIKHTSVYLPEAAYEALRQVAFDERRKIHDLLMEGVELALVASSCGVMHGEARAGACPADAATIAGSMPG